MFFFLTISALIAAINAEPILLKPAPRFPAGRIVGGESTEIEKYPYQISLEYFGSHDCGGSIISANYVVTAGHCTTRSPSLMTIRAGSSYKGQGGTVHQVEKIIRHEDYTMNRFGIPLNDVALIRVKEPFIFNETRQPINLFEAGEEAVPGVKSVITGWGNTGKGSPVQLQTVTIPIISKDLCDVAYQSYDGLPNGQICAAYFGVGGKDSCQGDSGGPLAIDGRLAGIVSWGNGCAQPNYPGVYTEVAAFREWIDEHLEV